MKGRMPLTQVHPLVEAMRSIINNYLTPTNIALLVYRYLWERNVKIPTLKTDFITILQEGLSDTVGGYASYLRSVISDRIQNSHYVRRGDMRTLEIK